MIASIKMIGVLRRFFQRRYRAALGGIFEVALVFAIASVLSLMAYNVYSLCMYQSRLTATANTLRTIRTALIDVEFDSTPDIRQIEEKLSKRGLKNLQLNALPCGRLTVDGDQLMFECNNEQDVEQIIKQVDEFTKKGNALVIVGINIKEG
jgi:hypothetical protein